MMDVMYYVCIRAAALIALTLASHLGHTRLQLCFVYMPMCTYKYLCIYACVYVYVCVFMYVIQ